MTDGSKMKRFITVLGSITGLFFLAGVVYVPSSAQATDETCFMVNPNGTTINLGRLCGNTQSPKGVFIAPIKRRRGGTPVIDVTFNGTKTFEMIVDTGASATLITRSMATALGVVPVNTIKVDTASSAGVKFPVGYVQSIAVDGAVANKVLVAIALSDGDIGLLGHDFFGNYDVTLKQNVVEFRRR